jgi:hypothetical protein
MSIANTLPNHLRPRREKVFGLARGFPHDRNARVRIEAYVLAWNANHKQEGKAPRADHRRLPACPTRASVAFHELQGRTLLSLLRDHRGEGPLLPRYGL